MYRISIGATHVVVNHIGACLSNQLSKRSVDVVTEYKEHREVPKQREKRIRTVTLGRACISVEGYNDHLTADYA